MQHWWISYSCCHEYTGDKLILLATISIFVSNGNNFPWISSWQNVKLIVGKIILIKLIFVVMLRFGVDGLGHLTNYHENYFFQNLIQSTNIQPKFSNQFKYISF